MTNPLVVIMGATATGKTALATHLASSLSAEIISADSRQVFRDMNIGTGKDLHAYSIEGKTIPYHLIDIRNAGEQYHVHAFQEDFYAVFAQLTKRKVLPILCGGTGMYIHSVLLGQEYTAIPVDQQFRDELQQLSKEGLVSKLAEFPPALTVHADRSSHKRLVRAIEVAKYLQENELPEVVRPVINPLVIGLYSDVASRRERIRVRLMDRISNGLVDEVQHLLNNGVSSDMLKFYGLEYKFVTAYLMKELSYDELLERLTTAICQYAKRQMTFFRKMEKDGVNIHWLSVDDDFVSLYNKALNLINRWKT